MACREPLEVRPFMEEPPGLRERTGASTVPLPAWIRPSNEPEPASSARIAELHRSEWPQLVASLARRFRSLDIAEEAAGEAFLAAVEHWRDGPPPNPAGG